MKSLSLKDVERVAFALARLTMSYNEPIPDFSTRFPNALESCLGAPFQNGNKRIAITALLVFLYKNKLWIKF